MDPSNARVICIVILIVPKMDVCNLEIRGHVPCALNSIPVMIDFVITRKYWNQLLYPALVYAKEWSKPT